MNMIKSWWESVMAGIPAAQTEQERKIWELDELLDEFRKLGASFVKKGKIYCLALLETKVAELGRQVGNISANWGAITRLWLQIEKMEPDLWVGKPCVWEYAAEAALKAGKHWVAACIYEEMGDKVAEITGIECSHNYRFAAKEYKWAFQTELEDFEGKLEALQRSQQCLVKFITNNPNRYQYMDILKEITYLECAIQSFQRTRKE